MNAEVSTDRAMILARGLGTRMQKQVEGLKLDEATSAMADEGMKGLIPVGRPFLDHTLQALLDAGLREFCLIVPPGASAIQEYYQAVAQRLEKAEIFFAVQDEPLGTAHAVAAGRDWAAEKPFMVFNSDNFYTPPAVRALAAAAPPATVAYERQALIAASNIPAERIRRFAVLDIDPAGHLRRIVEKPDDPEAYARDGKLYVSMNCFLLTPEIFQACASIQPHPQRREYELPAAVQYSIDELHLSYQAVKVAEGVLDLTGRSDIAPVRRMLADHQVRFEAPSEGEVQ
jgi:dTDP-glucose pyrophosphorylase